MPWWAHRRRRARVRVERKLEAWPEIAQGRRAGRITGHVRPGGPVGMAGPASPGPRPDHHRRDRARYPPSNRAWARTGERVRVYPTPDDLANRCELRVLDSDPHADAIPWPGPSVTSITQPIDLGPFEDAPPCRVLFLRRHGLVGGAPEAAKAAGSTCSWATWSPATDVVIWGIDLKKGMELRAVGRVHRPAGHHPGRGPRPARRRGQPSCEARAATARRSAGSASGSRRRTCPR